MSFPDKPFQRVKCSLGLQPAPQPAHFLNCLFPLALCVYVYMIVGVYAWVCGLRGVTQFKTALKMWRKKAGRSSTELALPLPHVPEGMAPVSLIPRLCLATLSIAPGFLPACVPHSGHAPGWSSTIKYKLVIFHRGLKSIHVAYHVPPKLVRSEDVDHHASQCHRSF